MPLSQKHLKPSIKQGCVGPGFGTVKAPLKPFSKADEQSDDDTGRLSRYCNPPGFVGLHGEEAGKNTWEKTGGMREVKRRTQARPETLKGNPFDD